MWCIIMMYNKKDFPVACYEVVDKVNPVRNLF